MLLDNKADNRLLHSLVAASCTVVLPGVALLRVVSGQPHLSALQKRMTAMALTRMVVCTIGSV